MPVDLSQVGLTGIKAFTDNQYTNAQRLALNANTDAQNLENQITQQNMQLDQQAAQALRKAASGDASPDVGQLFQHTGDSSAAPLETAAEVMLKGGAVKRGMDLLKAASDIRQGEAQIDKDESEVKKNKVEAVLKGANAVAQTIGVAQNESEWRWGLAELRKADILPPEQMDALDAMDYNPQVVDYLKSKAISMYQQALLDQQSTRDSTNRRQADERIANARHLSTIADARLKLAQRAEDRAEKSGKTPTAPNKDQVASAKAAVIAQVFNGKAPITSDDKAVLDAGASAIAARTQQLLRENKSLDFETAQNRAIIESQTAGDWEIDSPNALEVGIGKVPFGDLIVDDKTHIKYGAGKTPKTAVALPPNPKSLVKGKYYITAKGTARWNGKSFEASP
jgi:hypothetical protein